MNLWIIFLTGLTVGGLTCLAVQGGLLASVISARKEEEVEQGIHKRNSITPTLVFLAVKLFVYTLFGFLLGMFGSVVGINQTTQIIMQFVAGLYMIAIALDLLNVHPIFRYAVIQPPRFLTRKIRNQSKSKDIFAPALLGAMTIFIPCGTTLAMETLAVASANPIMGAAILGVFVLGTSPLFFGVGWLTSVLGSNFRAKFLRIAAVAIIYLGFSSVNGSLVAIGSPFSAQSIYERVNTKFNFDTDENEKKLVSVSQGAEIIVSTNGYSPNYLKVRIGSPVTIKLTSKDAYSCASAFRIPTLGISKNLQPNESYTFEFTPQKIGKIPFTCSMGMYTGIIDVI